MFSQNLAGNRGRGVEVDEEHELQGKDEITLAIESNNEESIRTAFERLTPEGSNRRRDVRSGYTPLHEAVRLKSSNAVKKLLELEHVEVELLDKSFHKACDYISNEEITGLFIEYYDNKINNLRKRLEDNSTQLEQAERTLHRRRSIFSYSGVGSFVAQVFIPNLMNK